MIATLTGGQFGSEGKGLIAGALAEMFDTHVRVGAANAGHTVYTNDGDYVGEPDRRTHEKHVLQQLPCAAYTNPRAMLLLGPGALISPEILRDEILRNVEWREKNGHRALTLVVDWRAHVVTADHIRREQETDLAERIGSTSTLAKEGIGTATAARVLREADCVTAADYFRLTGREEDDWKRFIDIGDVPDLINDPRRKVLLEGTQGTGLSITTGFFPYCTSRDTTAPGLIAQCGADPRLVRASVVVFRSYPIRVAGNSGPFYPDSQEIDWQTLNVDQEKERTTVTKKVRRVATFSMQQLRDAVRLNGATAIAFTFADYISPQMFESEALNREVLDYIDTIEGVGGVPVRYVGTGPHTVIERPISEAHVMMRSSQSGVALP